MLLLQSYRGADHDAEYCLKNRTTGPPYLEYVGHKHSNIGRPQAHMVWGISRHTHVHCRSGTDDRLRAIRSERRTG